MRPSVIHAQLLQELSLLLELPQLQCNLSCVSWAFVTQQNEANAVLHDDPVSLYLSGAHL